MIDENIKNTKYGRLNIIKEIEPHYMPSGQKVRKVLCQCDCGNIVEKNLYELTRKTKATKSCGCLSKEINSTRMTQYNKQNNQNRSVNVERKRIHNIYHCMKERCYNPKADSYKYYGQKGITICDEWLNDFNTFYEWSINNGYANNLSIDRVDSSLNYCPDNCKWVDNITQMNHTSRNVFLSNKQGIKKTITEWSRIYNIPAYSIRRRMIKYNLIYIEDCINIDKYKRYKKYK